MNEGDVTLAIVRTDKWFRIYCDQWSKVKTVHERLSLQRKVLIKPLCDVIETKGPDHLQRYLFQMGLSRPDVILDLEKWMKRKLWSKAQDQLIYLQKKWSGPDVLVYLLPIEERDLFLMRQLGGKTGMALRDAIILFIHAEIENIELRALITHEYHHICRLSHTNYSDKSIPLLESMIMEGLAEYAVKEELGKSYNAGWTTYYDRDWNHEWFQKWIHPNLTLIGRKNHHVFLYGDKKMGIPLWLGYYFGYRLVNLNVKVSETTCKLFRSHAEELYARSPWSSPPQ